MKIRKLISFLHPWSLEDRGLDRTFFQIPYTQRVSINGDILESKVFRMKHHHSVSVVYVSTTTRQTKNRGQSYHRVHNYPN